MGNLGEEARVTGQTGSIDEERNEAQVTEKTSFGRLWICLMAQLMFWFLVSSGLAFVGGMPRGPMPPQHLAIEGFCDGQRLCASDLSACVGEIARLGVVNRAGGGMSLSQDILRQLEREEMDAKAKQELIERICDGQRFCISEMSACLKGVGRLDVVSHSDKGLSLSQDLLRLLKADEMYAKEGALLDMPHQETDQETDGELSLKRRKSLAASEINRILTTQKVWEILGAGPMKKQQQEFQRIVRLLHPDKGLVSAGDKRALLALQLTFAARRSAHLRD